MGGLHGGESRQRDSLAASRSGRHTGFSAASHFISRNHVRISVSSMSPYPDTPSRFTKALWRATRLARAYGRTVDSGYPALPAQLPGAGWPVGTMIELLLQQAGIGEMHLLSPAAVAEKRSIALVAPQQTPHALGYAYMDVHPSRLMWLTTPKSSDGLWSVNSERCQRGAKTRRCRNHGCGCCVGRMENAAHAERRGLSFGQIASLHACGSRRCKPEKNIWTLLKSPPVSRHRRNGACMLSPRAAGRKWPMPSTPPGPQSAARRDRRASVSARQQCLPRRSLGHACW
jgi:hypothetical protein